MALFRWGRASRPQFDAPLTPEDPVIVIGDIHGRADLLDRLLGRIADLGQAEARIVCVGDYIDRGDDSAEVLAQVQALQQDAEDGRIVCLMGNHEKMLLEFLDAPEAWGPRWMRHGGLQTLASFRVGLATASASGGDPGGNAPGGARGRAGGPAGTSAGDAARDWPAIRDALRAALGAETEAWLRDLPLSWQTGNLFVAHAGADPACPIDDQDPHALLWGGEGFYDRLRDDGIWVAHGHVITEEARMTQGRIPLDTGAYATGRLTAGLVAPSGEVTFIQA